jgi:hypothetical protein
MQPNKVKAMMNELLTTLDAVVVYNYLYRLSPSKKGRKE